MQRLRDLRFHLPSGEQRQTILAIGVMAVGIVAAVVFTGFLLIPRLRERGDLVSRVMDAEQDLVLARKRRELEPDALTGQLADARIGLEETASLFLSESQAAEVLDGLHRTAAETGVSIVGMQAANEPQADQDGDLWDATTFHLTVMGTVRDLAKFVSSVGGMGIGGFEIADVQITEGDGPPTLDMGVTFYTSPYSQGSYPGAGTEAEPGVGSASVEEMEAALEAASASEDWPTVVDLARRLLGEEPGSQLIREQLYSAYVSYGNQLLSMARREQAATQFTLALSIQPQGEAALSGLDRALASPAPTLTAEDKLLLQLDQPWAAGDWETAIRVIEEVVAINPAHAAANEKLYAARVNHGRKLAAEGRLEDAKAQFTLALEANPKGGEAYAGLRDLAGITQPATATPPPEASVHIVAEGETLWSISQRYGVTVQAVMQANSLQDYNVRVGQQLQIPSE